MKTLHRTLLISSFAASAPAATMLYTNSTAFFSSSTWTGAAAAGSAVTENFVASGAVYNFTGNEQFNSNSYTYGTGAQQNTVTFVGGDGNSIFVDTTNESGGFLSFDSPGTSKYLYSPTIGSGSTRSMYILFNKPVSSFAFRLGDFGDPSSSWSFLEIEALRNGVSAGNLVYERSVNIARNDGDNNFNTLPLDLTSSDPAANLTPDYSSAGNSSIIIGDKTWAFMGWTFDTPVTGIVIKQKNVTNDSWGVDTVSFTTVPEPTAALLSGLGMLTLLRRRRA